MSDTEPNRRSEEGDYTETEANPPAERGVQGEYTATEDNPNPEPEDVVGGYTNTETDPDAHDRDSEQGEFTDSELESDD